MFWPHKPIIDVCAEAIDCVKRTAPAVDYGTPYKMLRTTNVRGGFVDVKIDRFVTEQTYQKRTRQLVPQKGDVFLTREAPLDDVGRLTSEYQVFLGQRFFHYRVNPDVLDARFLAYVLQSPLVRGRFPGYGFGATVEHAKVKNCLNLPIPVPPFGVQEKIGAMLAAFGDLIHHNLAANWSKK